MKLKTPSINSPLEAVFLALAIVAGYNLISNYLLKNSSVKEKKQNLADFKQHVVISKLELHALILDLGLSLYNDLTQQNYLLVPLFGYLLLGSIED